MDSRAYIRDRRRGKKICPESRTVIVDVYSFMKKEYELTRRTHRDCGDLSYLRYVEQRTAIATGVSVKTLQNLLKQERWERMKNLPNDAGATSEHVQVQEIPKETWQGKNLEGIKVMPARICPILSNIKELKLKPAAESTIQSKIKLAKNTSFDAKTRTDDDELLRFAGNSLNDFYLTSDSD